MISIKKLAPGRLSRAILALGGRSGNRPIRSSSDPRTVTVHRNEVLNHCPQVATLNRRITITVETERLLILSESQNWSDDSTGCSADDK